tara:strand:+ start:186 stop:1562 length:1377 start_codon:yes stop_codon:yes gene_type:complete
MQSQSLQIMNSSIPYLFLNFASSLSSAPNSIRSDQQLLLLLLLSKRYNWPTTFSNDATVSSVKLTEELQHQIHLCIQEFTTHHPAQHLQDSSPSLTKFLKFLLSNVEGDGDDDGWGLSNCNNSDNCWQHCSSGLLLGFFDSIRELVQSMQLLPETMVGGFTLKPQMLAVRSMQLHATDLLVIFKKWSATAEARDSFSLVREKVKENGVILQQAIAQSEWIAKRLTFRAMLVFETKEQGVSICVPTEIFYCSTTKEIYRVSELLDNTCEKIMLSQAHMEKYRIPENHVSKNLKEETAGLENHASGNMRAFEIIEQVRKVVRNASLEIILSSSSTCPKSKNNNYYYDTAIKSMHNNTTKVSVLIHNMEAVYCGSVILLSKQIWLFETSLQYPDHSVLIVANWLEQKSDVRCAFPSEAIIYEITLVDLSWGKSGTLVAIFRKKDVQHVIDYHRRFSICEKK